MRWLSQKTWRGMLVAAGLLAAAMGSGAAEARDQIRLVGSSTVFPFVSAAAEAFGANTHYPTPIVESTGTGGGFKLFCSGIGARFPDFSNASRAIKDSEVKNCAENGIIDIVEIKLGFDGIVLANSRESRRFDVTKKQIFMALAKEVPVNGALLPNPYTKWSDISSNLPDVKIEVLGPPPTSGTRDAFVELVMDEGCAEFAIYKETFPEKNDRKQACRMLREDGAFIEAGENENLIIQKLVNNHDALGIFGYSFLEQNADVMQGSLVEGVPPEFDKIVSGEYGISRSLFVYAKKIHHKLVPGMREFVKEMLSEDAMDSIDGYLTMKGLIPLREDDRTAVRAEVLSHFE